MIPMRSVVALASTLCLVALVGALPCASMVMEPAHHESTHGDAGHGERHDCCGDPAAPRETSSTCELDCITGEFGTKSRTIDVSKDFVLVLADSEIGTHESPDLENWKSFAWRSNGPPTPAPSIFELNATYLI